MRDSNDTPARDDALGQALRRAAGPALGTDDALHARVISATRAMNCNKPLARRNAIHAGGSSLALFARRTSVRWAAAAGLCMVVGAGWFALKRDQPQRAQRTPEMTRPVGRVAVPALPFDRSVLSAWGGADAQYAALDRDAERFGRFLLRQLPRVDGVR